MKQKQDSLSDKEVARELFCAGYQQAIDDARAILDAEGSGSLICNFVLNKLRARPAAVQARAALAKARAAS